MPEVFLSTLQPGLTIAGAQHRLSRRSRSPGEVASVDTRVDPTTRSVTIRALIDNRDGRLRPGMFMTVKLVRPEGQALMLPEQAIVPENEQQFVYVVEDGTRAQARGQDRPAPARAKSKFWKG